MDKINFLSKFYGLPDPRGKFLGSKSVASDYEKYTAGLRRDHPTWFDKPKFAKKVRARVKPGMEIVFNVPEVAVPAALKKRGRRIDDLGMPIESDMIIGFKERD